MAQRTHRPHRVVRAVRHAETVIYGTSGFMGFVWRHRVGLGPILTALGVLVSGLLVVWQIKSPTYVYTTFLSGAALLLAWVRFGVVDREGKQHARRERLHLYAVVVAALFWDIMLYRYVVPGYLSFRTGLTTLLWAALVLGAPWWWNLRRRTRVTLENDLDAWPIVTKSTNLANTWWTGFTKTTDGWTGYLNIPAQMARRTALESAELIEGLTSSPVDSVTVEPAGRHPNKVKVTCVTMDPFTDAILWSGKSVKSITQPATLGRYTDRTEERTTWFEKGVGGFHRLMGGVTRSGKSGLIHLLMALYAPADDVVVWGIDLKGGTSLLPWAPLCDWIATTVEEALIMCRCANALLDSRAHAVARMGKQVAPVSRSMPTVLLFCDEIASLIGDDAPVKTSRAAGSALVEVARKGAGLGLLLVLATQYPTLGALRSSQLRSQLGWRACFRLQKAGEGQYILPNMTKGVDPYRIPVDRRGTCYVDAQGVFKPAPLRIEYVREEEIRPIVDSHWQTRPQIDAASLAWENKDLVATYRARTRWTPQMLDRMLDGNTVEGHVLEDLYDDVDDNDGADGDDGTGDTGSQRANVDVKTTRETHLDSAATSPAIDPKLVKQRVSERLESIGERARSYVHVADNGDIEHVNIEKMTDDENVKTEAIWAAIVYFANSRMLGPAWTSDDAEPVMSTFEWLKTTADTSVSISMMLLFGALWGAGETGLTLTEIDAIVPRANATLRYWLNRWASHGLVHHVDRGTYTLVTRLDV